MSLLRLSIAVVSLLVATPSVSSACSPLPPGAVRPLAPSQVQVDASAMRLFQRSTVIAEVVVERSPRAQRAGETRPPAPGQLRVLRMIKGRTASILYVPLVDPCELYFQTVGERLIVAVEPMNQPSIVPAPIIASLRRRNLGDWGNVH